MSDRLLSPDTRDLGRLKTLLERCPNLSELQQEAFLIEWQRLAPRIRMVAPDWQPPLTGYFSIINVPFNRLLDAHDILSVPASVFGAPNDDFSILTCLHDLAAHAKFVL